MQSQVQKSVAPLLRLAIVGYAALVLGWICYVHLRETLYVPNGWKMGDWLINYSGGFVRRGLIGAGVLRLNSWFSLKGAAALWGPVLALQIFSYLVFFGTAASLASRARSQPLLVLLFFSPVFIAFPLLDTVGGFRKEILHFALFSGFALALANRNREWTDFLAWTSVWMLPLILLSHEMNFAALPYYWTLGWIGFGERRRAFLVWAAAVSIACAAVLGVSLLSMGTVEQQASICSSLLDRGFSSEICAGAIQWLPDRTAVTHGRVVQMTSQPGFWKYGVVGLLCSLGPLAAAVVGARKSLSVRPHLMAIVWGAVGSIVLMAPLFWSALDWGRFIHFQFATLSILLMATYLRGHGPVVDDIWLPKALMPARALAVPLVLLFAVSWSMPHYDALLGPGLAKQVVCRVRDRAAKEHVVAK